MPIGFFSLLRLPLLDGGVLMALDVVWKVALGLSCLGLYTRASTVTAFLLSLYLLGLPQNFGKIHHESGLVLLVLAVLALSRCGDALSLDCMLADARGSAGHRSSGESSSEYTWPIQLARVSVVAVFFAAGVSKMSAAGLRWAFSDNLSNLLVLHHYTFDPPIELGLALARYPVLAQGLALIVLVGEFGAPMALFSRRLRPLWAAAMAAMLVGFELFLGFAPWVYASTFVFWIPWLRREI